MLAQAASFLNPDPRSWTAFKESCSPKPVSQTTELSRQFEDADGVPRGIAWIGSILMAMALLAIFRRLTPDEHW